MNTTQLIQSVRVACSWLILTGVAISFVRSLVVSDCLDNVYPSCVYMDMDIQLTILNKNNSMKWCYQLDWIVSLLLLNWRRAHSEVFSIICRFTFKASFRCSHDGGKT